LVPGAMAGLVMRGGMTARRMSGNSRCGGHLACHDQDVRNPQAADVIEILRVDENA
jgi:hypothetical protein